MKKPIKNPFEWAILIFLVLAGITATQTSAQRTLNIGEEADIAKFTNTYIVERVIDGDTLLLANGEEVDLIGIDAPEMEPNDKAKRDAQRTGKDLETINKMGQEAAEFVKSLIKGGDEVRLEFDVEKKDKYGRLLAYVYLPSTFFAGEIDPFQVEERLLIPYASKGKGIFVNATIIQYGYASPTTPELERGESPEERGMTIPPNVKYAAKSFEAQKRSEVFERRRKLFQKLYEEARENRRGLWATLEGDACKTDDDCKNLDCRERYDGEKLRSPCKAQQHCEENKCECALLCVHI